MDAHDWNDRYAAMGLIWSEEPNQFVADVVQELTAGRALDLACGEGRSPGKDGPLPPSTSPMSRSTKLGGSALRQGSLWTGAVPTLPSGSRRRLRLTSSFFPTCTFLMSRCRS